MKKKIIITILSFCILIPCLYFLNVIIDPFDLYWNEGEPDDYDKYVEEINEYYDTIYFYGEEIYFRDSLKIVENIDGITEENLVNSDGNKKIWLVINDISGTVKLEDKDFEVISKAMTEKKISFVYIGNQYISKLNEYFAGEDERYAFGGDEYSALYQVTDYGIIAESGTVDEITYNKFTSGEDKEILSRDLLASISHAIGDYK